jgi:hypothetical protein
MMTKARVSVSMRINYILLGYEHLLLIIYTAPARGLSPQLGLGQTTRKANSVSSKDEGYSSSHLQIAAVTCYNARRKSNIGQGSQGAGSMSLKFKRRLTAHSH